MAYDDPELDSFVAGHPAMRNPYAPPSTPTPAAPTPHVNLTPGIPQGEITPPTYGGSVPPTRRQVSAPTPTGPGVNQSGVASAAPPDVLPQASPQGVPNPAMLPPYMTGGAPPPTPTAGSPGGTPTVPPTTGGNPMGITDYMRKLMQPQFDYEQEQYARAANAQSALTGQINSGGNAESFNRGMAQVVAGQGKVLSDAIMTGNEAELNRQLQKYGIDMQHLTSEDVAHIQAAAQMAAAQANAGAAGASAQANLQGVLASIAQRQKESQQQFDLGVYGINAQNYRSDQQAQLAYLQMLMGMSPEQRLAPPQIQLPNPYGY